MDVTLMNNEGIKIGRLKCLMKSLFGTEHHRR
jgi:hypothetical protein